MRSGRGSLKLAYVSLRRLLVLSLVAAILVLAPTANASPPDASWPIGLYDDDDFDNVVLFITSSLGITESNLLGSLHSLPYVVGPATPMTTDPRPVSPLLSVVGRAPPPA